MGSAAVATAGSGTWGKRGSHVVLFRIASTTSTFHNCPAERIHAGVERRHSSVFFFRHLQLHAISFE